MLRCASVHPARARELVGASAVAWVSWLLYWASPAGAKLTDPIGHAVSRLKEAPDAPMGGAYERLALLGPVGLANLVVPRVLNPWDVHPENQDWEDAMRGLAADRMRRLVDLLGFDLADSRELEVESSEGLEE